MLIPLGRPFGVPVFATGSALLVAAFIVFGRAGVGAHPGAALLHAGVLFGSILVHELGHAVVGKRLGLAPQRILLHGFGGLCEYGRAPRPREGVISGLAGPLAGLALGVIALIVWLVFGSSLSPTLADILSRAVWINLFWSLFNLIPMYPLDGGTVLWHGLRSRTSGARAWSITRTVGIGAAVLVGLVGLVTGEIFIAIVAGLSLAQLMSQR